METKEQLLTRLGKNDDNDDVRWDLAIDMAGELDRHVNFCFEEVIELENKGLIELRIVA